MNNSALLDTWGTVFLVIYILSLILVGLAGKYASKENSLADFYLGGRGIGLFVLFLTLYASQYSGHTIIGFPGKAYRIGYPFIYSVIAMMSVIAAYLFFAPKLHTLSKKYNFITIGDYIQHRYGSDIFTILVSVSAIIALANFILSNLKAVGYVVETATGGVIGFEGGIILLSLVMIIYETLGGMRSVAWTDAIQGVLLFIGVVAIFIITQFYYGGFDITAAKILEFDPKAFDVPTLSQKNLWLSTILIFMFGVSVYPHAIQRIYAAKNTKVLKRSLQIMIFMPLFTTLLMFIIGLTARANFPGLAKAESDQIVMVLLSDMASNISGISILITLFIAAAVAAIMSTIDSALLAISSLFTKDIFLRIKKDKSEAELTKIGKIFSWGIMGIMALLAIYLPQTIWRIMEIKLELLCQIAPAIYFGIHSKKLSVKSVMPGFFAGTVVAVGIMLLNIYNPEIISTKPFGFHAGIWGLAANILTILIMNKYKNES